MRYRRDPYLEKLQGQELADYLAIASRLPEAERQHAIDCGMSARAMLRARMILPSVAYCASVDGTSSFTVHDQLVSRVARGMLAAADAADLPPDIRRQAAIVNDVTRAMEAIAQAAREGRFDFRTAAVLAFAAQRLAKARGEDPASVTQLVDAVLAAVREQNAYAVREALDAVAEHFGLGIDAPRPPSAALRRKVALGVDVGIVTQIVW